MLDLQEGYHLGFPNTFKAAIQILLFCHSSTAKQLHISPHDTSHASNNGRYVEWPKRTSSARQSRTCAQDRHPLSGVQTRMNSVLSTDLPRDAERANLTGPQPAAALPYLVIQMRQTHTAAADRMSVFLKIAPTASARQPWAAYHCTS